MPHGQFCEIYRGGVPQTNTSPNVTMNNMVYACKYISGNQRIVYVLMSYIQ